MERLMHSGALSDMGIIRRMVHPDRQKRIIITPLIDLEHQLGPNSIDLRLGTEFVLDERAEYTCMDPLDFFRETDDQLKRRHRRIVRMSPRKPFILHPEEQVTSSTLESVRIPDDIAALLEGRSTWARQGLGVHSTAGFVHAGSRGVIALELRNDGPVPIKLYPGMRVAQLSFLMLDQDCASGYYGKDVKYSADFRPETGSPWKDYEFALFNKDERDGRDGKTGLFERILESFS